MRPKKYRPGWNDCYYQWLFGDSYLRKKGKIDWKNKVLLQFPVPYIRGTYRLSCKLATKMYYFDLKKRKGR